MAWSGTSSGSNWMSGPTRNAMYSGLSASSPNMVNTNVAGLAMALPAAAQALSAISPVWGSIASGIAQIPGQMIDYENRKQAAEAQNKNTNTAFNLLSRVPTDEKLNAMYGKLDTRPAIINEMIDTARSNQVAKDAFASDALSKSAANGLPITARDAYIDKGLRSMDSSTRDTQLGIIERGREYTSNMLMNIANIKQQAIKDTMQRQYALAMGGLQALTQPINVADFASNMGNINSSIDAANQFYLEKRQIELQEQQARKQNELAWAGMGVNTAMGIGQLGVGMAGVNAMNNMATAGIPKMANVASTTGSTLRGGMAGF